MSSTNLTKNLGDKISYEQKPIKDFCTLTQGVIDSHGHGCDPKVYEAVWKLLGNKDNATVFITMLLGKLVLHEKTIKNENDDSLVNEFNEHPIDEVLREMRIDSHQPNPTHVHLTARKEGIRRRKEEDAKDTNDEELDIPFQQLFTNGALLNTILFVATTFRIEHSNPGLLYVLDKYLEQNSKTGHGARLSLQNSANSTS
jgi:hypothetical protein